MSCDSAGLPSQSLVGTRLLVMSWAMGLTSAMGGPCSLLFPQCFGTWQGPGLAIYPACSLGLWSL
jgi:hypothetical protein